MTMRLHDSPALAQDGEGRLRKGSVQRLDALTILIFLDPVANGASASLRAPQDLSSWCTGPK